MTAPQADSNEFLDLLSDLAEDRLSPERAAALQRLFLADSARPQEYVDFMLMLSGLHWIGRDRPGGDGPAGIDEVAADALPFGDGSGPEQTPPIVEPFASPAPLAPPIAVGDQAAFQWLGSGVLLSYLVAAMVLWGRQPRRMGRGTRPIGAPRILRRRRVRGPAAAVPRRRRSWAAEFRPSTTAGGSICGRPAPTRRRGGTQSSPDCWNSRRAPA